jgi:hypothetical protein
MKTATKGTNMISSLTSELKNEVEDADDVFFNSIFSYESDTPAQSPDTSLQFPSSKCHDNTSKLYHDSPKTEVSSFPFRQSSSFSLESLCSMVLIKDSLICELNKALGLQLFLFEKFIQVSKVALLASTLYPSFVDYAKILPLLKDLIKVQNQVLVISGMTDNILNYINFIKTGPSYTEYHQNQSNVGKGVSQQNLQEQKNLQEQAESRLSCHECGNCYTTSYALKRHCKVHHSFNIRFKCNLCKKSFLEENSLRRHKIIHTGIKPFRCEVCGKRFSDSSNFTRHGRIHLPEKRPYGCRQCDRKYSRLSVLRKHVLKKHGVEEKSFF